MSTMVEHIAENPTLVTSQDLLPAINVYFGKLSELQWIMIKDGAWDSDVRALLADMISEIIQQVSAKILRLVVPLIQIQIMSGESPEGDLTEKIKVSLGDSVSDSIASSLNVRKETCKSAQKLTQMIEEEVSEKINLATFLLTQSPDLPSDPAIYISGRLKKTKNLHHMVFCAASCLRKYASQLHLSCMCQGDSGLFHCCNEMKESASEVCKNLSGGYGEGGMTEQHDEDDEEEYVDMELTEAAEVEKPEESQDFTHTKGQTENFHSPILAEKIVSDMIEIASEILDSSSDELSDPFHSRKRSLNTSLMISRLRNLYSTCFPSTDRGKQDIHKQQFYAFAEKQFVQMRKGLKEGIKLNSKYLICLLNMAKSPQEERQASPESIDCSPPGSVPDTPCSESSTSSRAPSTATPTLESVVKCPPLSFDTIKSDLSNLYNKLTKEGQFCISNIPENSTVVRDVAKDLTNKIFVLLMRSEIPVPVMGRALSDSIISRTPRQVGSPFPSEVLYVLIEDLVERFLQKIVIWMDNQEFDQTVQADMVSGAIGDIQHFMARAPNLIWEDTESDLWEQSDRESAASLPSRSSLQNLFLAESSSTSSPVSRPKCTLLEQKSQSEPAFFPGASQDCIRQPSPSEKGLSQVSVSLYDAKRLSKKLSSFLVIRIITKSRQPQLLTSAETNMLVDYLEALVNQEISNIESGGNLEDSVYQFTRSLYKRLVKEFGSPYKVLEASLARDSSFKEAVLRNLKFNLGVFPSLHPKKSKVSRFFSAVGKAFVKPFRCCFRGSDD